MSDGEVKWMPVLCEANVTTETVRSLQRALSAKGYNPGSVDGRLGPGTMEAVFAFQRAEGLAAGELTLQTLNKLGVKL
jgi:peptidoglycan hydrolase-like protein with peptidoglycan-binding domain